MMTEKGLLSNLEGFTSGSNRRFPDFFSVVGLELAAIGDAERRNINLENLGEELSRHPLLADVHNDHRNNVIDIIARYASGDASVINLQSLTTGRNQNLEFNALGRELARVMARFGYSMSTMRGEHTIDGIVISHPESRSVHEFRRNIVDPTFYIAGTRREQDPYYVNNITFTEDLRARISGRGNRI